MADHIYNIAEAKMHLSKLIERVERGERITIARNHRPVAIVSPATRTPAEVLAQIDSVREQIRAEIGGNVATPDVTLRDLIEEGRSLA